MIQDSFSSPEIALVLTTLDSEEDKPAGMTLAADGDSSIGDFSVSTDFEISSLADGIDLEPSLPDEDFLDSPLFDDRERKRLTMAHQVALLLERGQLDEAMDWLIALEREFREAPEVPAYCLKLRADVLTARGDGETALALLRRWQTLEERAGRRVALSHCLERQAAILADFRRYNEALAILSEQERICREVGLAAGLAAALAGQARIHAARGDNDSALALLSRQESVCRLHALHEQLLQCLGQQSTILRRAGDNRMALAVLEEQVRLADQLGNDRISAIALGNQAAVFESLGEFGSAELLYMQAEFACRRLGKSELLARNLVNQAFMLSFRLQRHREALSQASEARALAVRDDLAALAPQIEQIYRAIRSRMK